MFAAIGSVKPVPGGPKGNAVYIKAVFLLLRKIRVNNESLLGECHRREDGARAS
jgi:hypothetical protein